MTGPRIHYDEASLAQNSLKERKIALRELVREIQKKPTYMKDYPGAKWVASPNHGGILYHHDYIVVHYTAGANLNSSVNWLCNPQARASAHLVIGRDGSIVQLVSLEEIAWACGESGWKGVHGLNSYSLSIELDNCGPLRAVSGGGGYQSIATGTYVTPENVFIGKHKNGGSFTAWETYADQQVETLKQVVFTLRNAYPTIKEVIGHDDIAPGRKTDPGPALAQTMKELQDLKPSV